MAGILLRANPRCALCLGSGAPIPLHVLCGTTVCRCITEQITILTVPKDYSIPQRNRYIPGHPEFVEKAEGQ